MVDRLIHAVAIVAATLFLLGAGITPFMPTLTAIAVGGAELHSMRDTGLPSSAHLLNWTDWKPMDETVQSTDWAPHHEKLSNAQIISYRIGHARGFISQFTFYQARYVLADKSEVIAPARGPISLISAWIPGVVCLSLLQLAMSVSIFMSVVRRTRATKPT